jgi:hypothetical protein
VTDRELLEICKLCIDHLQGDEMLNALSAPKEAGCLSQKVNSGRKAPLWSSGDVSISLSKRRICSIAITKRPVDTCEWYKL